MNEKQIIRAALKRCGWTQPKLASVLGYKTNTAVGSMLNSKSTMKLDTFFKMLDAMGFEVVVRSKYPGMGKDEWNLVDNDEPICTERIQSDDEKRTAQDIRRKISDDMRKDLLSGKIG